MKNIPLTRGQFAIVDDDMFEYISQWKWHALKQPHTYYAARNVTKNKKKETIWMHRIINKTSSDKKTDHINGNGLDNRKKNLRSATHQENMINCARWVEGSSKYRGVSWHCGNKKWYAQITVNYKNLYVGSFDTEKQAKLAYDAKRSEIRAGQLIRKGK